MKRIVHSVWSGLALAGLAAQAFAVTSGSGGNPYHAVVVRNVFDLNPAPPPVKTPPQPPTQPAKIWLQGISDILNKKQVLLKIQEPPKLGEQPKERALIMEEGERRGSVTVLEINPNARTVKFDNAGTEQTLELTSAPNKLTGSIPGVSTVPSHAAAAAFASSKPTPTLPTHQLRATSAPRAAVPSQSQLTAEQQIILMEIERERTKAEVIKGELPPLPPTELTPPDAPGHVPPPPPGD